MPSYSSLVAMAAACAAAPMASAFVVPSGLGLCTAPGPTLSSSISLAPAARASLAHPLQLSMAAAQGDKPKRPLSAYFLYAQDARASVKAANPSMANTEIVKKLGEQWRSLDAATKKKYEDTASKARDEWNAKYKTAKPEKEKKPLSAYMIYANETRSAVTKANPTAKFGDIAKIIGAEWKKLGPAAKQPYLDKEKAGKDAYAAKQAK